MDHGGRRLSMPQVTGEHMGSWRRASSGATPRPFPVGFFFFGGGLRGPRWALVMRKAGGDTVSSVLGLACVLRKGDPLVCALQVLSAHQGVPPVGVGCGGLGVGPRAKPSYPSPPTNSPSHVYGLASPAHCSWTKSRCSAVPGSGAGRVFPAR